MNPEECSILNEIHACQELSQVNTCLIQAKNKEALRNILPYTRADFLNSLLPSSSISTINEFLEHLITLDPKQAKKIVESMHTGALKQLIDQEQDAWQISNLFYTLVHRLYALSFFKKMADFEILRKKKWSMHQFSQLYGYLYCVKKIDNTFKVTLDFEMLANALKDVDVNQLVVDIDAVFTHSKEFLENLFGVLETERILSDPQLTLKSMEKFLDMIYETDRELFSRVVKENIRIIKAKLRECLVLQTEDAGKLVDFMYKAAPKYAEELIEKDALKSLLDSELPDIHDASDLVMVLLKRNPSLGKELVPCILRSRAFLHFFNYDEYFEITDARQRLKLLHFTLETLFKKNKEGKFFYFFSYFARSELLKIASEGCSSIRIVFPEFLDIQLEESFDNTFSITDEAEEFNLREMGGSSLETKEEILLDVHMESEKDDGTKIFFEMLNEESDKIDEKFKKRHAECLLKPNNAEKLIILADLFSAMYARKHYYADVPYQELINELGVLAEKIEIDL